MVAAAVVAAAVAPRFLLLFYVCISSAHPKYNHTGSHHSHRCLLQLIVQWRQWQWRRRWRRWISVTTYSVISVKSSNGGGAGRGGGGRGGYFFCYAGLFKCTLQIHVSKELIHNPKEVIQYVSIQFGSSIYVWHDSHSNTNK